VGAVSPELHESVARLFGELVRGAPPGGPCFVLNPGDAGLLASLGRVSAESASRPSPSGGASVAAHVDHLCYALELLNRWGAGEPNPWAEADWGESWRRGTVAEEAWEALRGRLAREAERALEVLATPRELAEVERTGLIAHAAHLAYHMGAIRQIDRDLKGPPHDG
jgi:hypothetical protein